MTVVVVVVVVVAAAAAAVDLFCSIVTKHKDVFGL